MERVAMRSCTMSTRVCVIVHNCRRKLFSSGSDIVSKGLLNTNTEFTYLHAPNPLFQLFDIQALGRYKRPRQCNMISRTVNTHLTAHCLIT